MTKKSDQPKTPTTTLVLVRHAVTDLTGKQLYGRLPGVHLSDEGRTQAKNVAQRLADLPIKAVYTSPLERAKETADEIANALQLTAIDFPDITEVDYGDLVGMDFTELKDDPRWKVEHLAPSLTEFPGGESMAQVQARVCTGLLNLVEKHSGEMIVAVAHRDSIQTAVAYFSGAPLDSLVRVDIAPASVTVIQFGERGVMLLKENDTGTLEDIVPHEGQHA